jgi:hypothetical protein
MLPGTLGEATGQLAFVGVEIDQFSAEPTEAGLAKIYLVTLPDPTGVVLYEGDLLADALSINCLGWSDDGQTLFISAFTGSAEKVIALDMTTGEAKEGSNFTCDFQFALSPDGTKQAFYQVDSATELNRVVIADADGGDITPIFEDASSVSSAPAWSSDSRFIAFTAALRSGDRLVAQEIALVEPGVTGSFLDESDTVTAYAPAWRPVVTIIDTPTEEPTLEPTIEITPTEEPTAVIFPTDTPTSEPTVEVIPTEEPTPVPSDPTVTLPREVVARSGPNALYAEVAKVAPNEPIKVIGLSDDLSWLLLELPDGQEGWIAFIPILTVSGDLNSVPTIANIPTITPPPTATPIPATSTPTPTSTDLPTSTPTPTETPTATNTPTATFTSTSTPTNTATASFTPSATPTSTPTSTPTPTPEPQLLAIVAAPSNIRSEPRINARVVLQVEKEGTYTVVQIVDDATGGTLKWYEISLPDSNDKTGFVRQDRVNPVLEIEPGLQVTLTPTPTPTFNPNAAQTRCVTSFRVGDFRVVSYNPGVTEAYIRTQPNGRSPVVLFLENNRGLDVIGGPRSDGRQCWYQVNVRGTGHNGWIEEGIIR